MSAHTDMREMLARRAELSPTQEMQLRDHLHSCPDCRRTADAYARQTTLLRTLPSVDPPSEIRSRVLQSIHQSRPPARTWPSLRSAVFAAPLAAALLIVLAALVYVNRPRSVVHTASGIHQHPTAARLDTPKPQKDAGLKNTAAPLRAAQRITHVGRKTTSPRRALSPTPSAHGPTNGNISPSAPQQPQLPVVSQQVPPTSAARPTSAPSATPPAVAALASQPATQRAATRQPVYGPVASTAGGAPTSATKQEPRATPTPAPLPPGIAAPVTPPAYGAAPTHPTATAAAAVPPTIPPSTPTATSIPVGAAASAPTPLPARSAAPAEPPMVSPTPLATPTP